MPSSLPSKFGCQSSNIEFTIVIHVQIHDHGIYRKGHTLLEILTNSIQLSLLIEITILQKAFILHH